jgi:hypothetical protein
MEAFRPFMSDGGIVTLGKRAPVKEPLLVNIQKK